MEKEKNYLIIWKKYIYNLKNYNFNNTTLHDIMRTTIHLMMDSSDVLTVSQGVSDMTLT